MSKPELLLLDEPSLGLAPKLVEKIFETILEINKSGVTTKEDKVKKITISAIQAMNNESKDSQN